MRALILLSLMLLGLSASLSPSTANALDPEERLADPLLESRARALSQQLRCLVCQNQSIDDSEAPLAKDLRIVVREQLLAGNSDTEILAFLHNRYGDYVLLKPPLSTNTLILWGSPIIIVLIGLGLLALHLRQYHPLLPSAPPPVLHATRSNLRPAPLLLLGIVVFGLSTSGYLWFGRPDLPAQPLRERAAEIDARQQANQSKERNLREEYRAAEAATRLNPESSEAWYRLANAAAASQNAETEITALHETLRLDPERIMLKSQLAEAMSRAADGQITLPARRLIDEVLTQEPLEPHALFLKGLAAFQDSDYAESVALWQHLLDNAPPAAPWIAMVRENLRQAAEVGNLPLPE